MEPVTCFVVDDEREACLRMCDIIGKFPELKLLGYEQEVDEAVGKIVKMKPHIVFLDIEMPGKNGFEILKEVRNHNIFPTFIFVTAYGQYAIDALRERAFDYLLKPVDIREFKEAFERYRARNQTLTNFDHTNLTEREKEVARLLCQGKTSKEIAAHLFISVNTVNSHRKAILKKLGFKNTSEMLASFSGEK